MHTANFISDYSASHENVDLMEGDDDWSVGSSSTTDLMVIRSNSNEDLNNMNRDAETADGTAAGATAGGRGLSAEDIAILQRLDREYERALDERDVSYMARYESVRQSAVGSVLFMVLFIALGTIFFVRQTDWTVSECLLFSIYTITTVGYGHLENPDSPAFQWYTIFYILAGVATLTIMVAQVYQCISLTASRAQYEKEGRKQLQRVIMNKPIIQRARAAGVAKQQQLQQTTLQQQSPMEDVNAVDQPVGEIIWKIPLQDRIQARFEKCVHFFRFHPTGRALSVIFPFVGLIGVGAAVLAPLEGWTATQAIYFSVVSLTTVGFGDLFPTHTISVWFCIFWLPFSVGFMSFFLTNVAAFYIRLSDRNVTRIERQLRRRLQLAKKRAQEERQNAYKRALRGQQERQQQQQQSNDPRQQQPGAPPVDNVHVDEEDDDDDAQQGMFPGQLGLGAGEFETVPPDDTTATRSSTAIPQSPDNKTKTSSKNSHPYDIYQQVSQRRRLRILKNHQRKYKTAAETATSSEGTKTATSSSGRPDKSNMTTMRDMIRTVHENIAAVAGTSSKGGIAITSTYFTVAKLNFRAGPGSEFFSIRSNSTMMDALQENTTIRKPTVALRVLVQERMAEIIALEVAGYQNSMQIKDTVLSVRLDVLTSVTDKWLIPRRARKAFRAVAMEAIFFVGEHGLIVNGAGALYELTVFEFHALFSPLLAALGDADTMENWLANTQDLAETELVEKGTFDNKRATVTKGTMA